MNLNKQYFEMVAAVMSAGKLAKGRNGNTYKLFGPSPIIVRDIRVSFPLLQVKKTPFFKSVLETCFFLSGDHFYDSMPEDLANTWWKPWADKAKANDSWGRFYSTQWRHQLTNKPDIYFDALKSLLLDIVEVLETGVENRTMVVSLWHKPDSLPLMCTDPAVLASCHSTALIFNVEPGDNCWYLDLHHTQRSLDLMCGTGADLVYSGLLMEIICNLVSQYTKERLLPRQLIFAPVNTHIYENHIPEVERFLANGVGEYSPVVVSLKKDFKFNTFREIKTVEKAREYFAIDVETKWLSNYSFGLNE